MIYQKHEANQKHETYQKHEANQKHEKTSFKRPSKYNKRKSVTASLTQYPE